MKIPPFYKFKKTELNAQITNAILDLNEKHKFSLVPSTETALGLMPLLSGIGFALGVLVP